MTIRLKQSTASQEIPLGVFVDETDGKTAETGLTIANTDIKLWKAGATSLVNKNAGGATHMAGGIYYTVLDDTDTNTLGALVIFVHVSGALPIRVECEVLPANVYDSLISFSDRLQVDAVQIGGTNQSGGDLGSAISGLPGEIWDYNNSLLITANSIGKKLADNVDATISSRLAAASYSTSDIADAVWDESLAGHSTVGSVGDMLNDTHGYAVQSLIELGTAGDGLTAIPWNAAWDAEVESEVSDALIAMHLDHLLAATYDPASKPGAADALLNELVESDAGVSRFTANALEQAPAGGGGGGATAQEVWEYGTRTLTGAVTVGTNNDKTGYSLAAGQLVVKKNTALNNFEFLMRQSADHITPSTGLTVTAERSIDGAAFAACANAVSEVGSGVYKINLAASDLNGDVITLKFTASGADQRTITILTQP